MAVIGSTLDPDSEVFDRDRQMMLAALRPIEELAAKVLEEGGRKAVDRHRSRGKLLARERVDLLLDEDAPFLELSCYAGAHDPQAQPGGRLITGIGTVNGVECMILANQSTVKGGSLNPDAVAKQLRALEIADRNRLPLITMVESGGADLPSQANIFVPGGRFVN
jgi:acetyl-CoA carboxylase carboxyltransferase component